MVQQQKVTHKDTNETLTEGQQAALDQIRRFLNANDRAFCLTGFAGTGKTYLTNVILEEAKNLKLKTILASPTNKAAKVLGQVTDQETVTVAQLLGIRPKIDKTTGKEVFTPDYQANRTDLTKVNLVIIDEASMISAELLELLQQEFTLFGPKFLFIGDPAQLPPINEEKSLVFDVVDDSAHLDEVVRYDGSTLNWATALRNQNILVPATEYADGDRLIIKDDRAFSEAVIETFSSNAFEADPDYCRVLAWTNASVDRWNQLIRTALFGKDAPPYVEGERLISVQPCIKQVTKKGGKVTKEEVILTGSSEVEVIEATPVTKTIEYGNLRTKRFHFWAIKAMDEDGMIKHFRILDESEEERLNSLLNDHAKRKEWRDFWSLKKYFHPLKYSYAMTCHKSQGSTFQTVFLDLKNILLNKKPQERNKLLYTSATRASDHMIVLA